MTNTIALVDDDRNILTSVSMALEAEGFAVRCYSDGAEALKGMTAQPVDLAVLDIKMPRLDGMELLSQLRRQSHICVAQSGAGFKHSLFCAGLAAAWHDILPTIHGALDDHALFLPGVSG